MREKSRRKRGILLIVVGFILLGSVGVMVAIGVLGGVNGVYIGLTPIVSPPPFVSEPGLTFYGLIGSSTTLCALSNASTTSSCTSTTILFLSGFQDLACLHVTNACWNQTVITQYHLAFPLNMTKLPAVNANVVQVNGTLVLPSSLGTTLAPGGDVYVTAWRNYVIYVPPKPARLSFLTGVTVPVSGFNVDLILVVLPASVGIVLVITGSYVMKSKPRKR